MSKLIVSEIESTGTSVQINDDLKVGSTGTNVITSANVVAPSEDMIKNFKAFENPITIYDAAVSSTGVPGEKNAVPHETSTSTGLTSTTALSVPSTGGNALLTNLNANSVYLYASSGTANCRNDYWGVTIDIPAAFRGENIVLNFDYRTEAAGTNDTAADQWFVAVQDKSNTVQTTQSSTLTSGTTIAAGSNILMTSKSGLSVGDKIWFETGGTSSTTGNVNNSITEAYITEISSTDNNIKVSQDVQVITSGQAVTKFLTNTLQLLPAADSDTNKVGKNHKLAFKTEENTSQVNVFFQLRNTSSTVVHSLYFDNVYLSSNKFLQVSEQVQESAAFYGQNATFVNYTWYYDNTRYDTTGQLVTITNSSTEGFKITANQPCYVFAQFNNLFNSNYDVYQGWTLNGDRTTAMPYASTDTNVINVQRHDSSVGHNTTEGREFTAYIKLNKGDYIIPQISSTSNPPEDKWMSNMLIKVESVGNKSVVMESQDEIFTDWQSFTPAFATANWADGGANDVKVAKWRRIGDTMEVNLSFKISTGTVSTANALIPLPDGYSVDLSKCYDGSHRTTALGIYARLNGTSSWFNVSTYAGCVIPVADGTLSLSYYAASDDEFAIPAINGIFGASETLWLEYKVPIQGWNSNFNPLLSMPLVDIGGTTEQALYYGAVSTNATTNDLRPYYTNESYNTVSSLGVLDNSTTLGWNFKATQRVKATLNWSWSSTSAGTYSGSLIKKNTLGTNVSDGSTDWNGYKIARMNTIAASNPSELTATVLMEPGDYLFPVTNITNSDSANDRSVLSLVVEKDYSNTNMAHIIKPAVATIKDIKAYNVHGDTISAGAWNTLTLNTLEGESWFLTAFASSLFTLEPGTYKFSSWVPFYKSDNAQSRLYNITDSKVQIIGTSIYSYSGENEDIPSFISGTFTITANTQFKMQYWGEAAGRIGTSAYDMPDSESVYTTVTIEKLK